MSYCIHETVSIHSALLGAAIYVLNSKPGIYLDCSAAPNVEIEINPSLEEPTPSVCLCMSHSPGIASFQLEDMARTISRRAIE